MEITPEDLIVEVYRTDTKANGLGIRVIHEPTGTEVCGDSFLTCLERLRIEVQKLEAKV